MAKDFESFIVDPSLLDPSIDATDLRTTTDTRQELLSDVPDYQGIQYDPTQRSYISDLYALYSGQLPSRPATPSAPPRNNHSTRKGSRTMRCVAQHLSFRLLSSCRPRVRVGRRLRGRGGAP